MTTFGGAALATLLGAATLLIRVGSLPVMPIDETRYLSVAWEMWQHHAVLVPLLNGAPYSHKPPLLFWLLRLGWALFGTSELVSRMVIPAVGLGAFWLLADIVRRLAPEARATTRWAPLVLFGTTLWWLYLPLSMFDILLATCLLLAVDGLVRYLDGGRRRALLLAGLGLGLGVLAKGPAVYLYWLPLALGLRDWRPSGCPTMAAAYRGVLAASLLGGLIGLAWALPAVLLGGADYAEAILWNQSAGRVADAFDHARPWYWYLPVLFVATLPWSTLWRRQHPWLSTPLQRFAAWGVLPPLVLLSLISGKQIHYLMPTLPFLAIWLAERLVTRTPGRPWGLITLLVGVAGLMLALPELAGRYLPAESLSGWTRLGALLPLGLAAGLLWRPHRLGMVTAWPAALLALLLLLSPTLQRHYDLTPMAERLAALERVAVPLAYAGDYQDQFRFLGRLTTDLSVFEDDQALAAWATSHPEGYLIASRRSTSAALERLADFHQPYRGRTYFLVPASRWSAFTAN
ncbi:ArnT family glycosyltransferase [Halomonas organivorans]|uniref:4-amino-4-deoxy-L-arabinose transferase-like glycosyltransferase n=1 Tax=Halomonas organivorans TaxID=257772 RepID=A0A7W5BU60_9GAMM|nr:glycosyltransferase family 39 protein [Halomonas organivorans]MBB3139207.1 4-amino-4-deoxy-L-arabinose transferase-like glycosyltransferase [Halomonas organivorans]